MKSFSDYHIHTTYSDGKNTPEETVKAAIEKGMTEIGFSDHSYTFFDESYCLKRDKIAEYKSEIARLKEKYKSQIKILCGIEQDAFAECPAIGYDYSIGSAHYVRLGDEYVPVDETAAVRFSCGESRAVLSGIGIRGELLSTPSHSRDSVSLLLDDGVCIVGDLEPLSYLEGYGENAALRRDWERLLARRPREILYAHASG